MKLGGFQSIEDALMLDLKIAAAADRIGEPAGADLVCGYAGMSREGSRA